MKLESSSPELLVESLKKKSPEELRELRWLLTHPEYEERPVSIDSFMYDINYLNIGMNVRPKIKEVLRDIFGESGTTKPYNEAIIRGAIGTGKSFTTSIALPYIIYRLLCLKDPQTYFGLTKGSNIHLMIMSTSEDHARHIIFSEVSARIVNSRWFRLNNRLPNQKVKTELQFPKNITLIPGNSQDTFFEGYNIFAGAIDEADSHGQTADRDFARIGYDAIKERIRSRFGESGLLLVIGSPKDPYGFLTSHYNEMEIDPKCYRVTIPYWESPNPKQYKYSGETFEFRGLTIPVEHKPDFNRNPEKAMRDMAAQPGFSQERFYTITEKLENFGNPNIVSPTLDDGVTTDYIWPSWFMPTTSFPRAIHIDLGINKKRGDYCGFAMSHICGLRKVDNGIRPIVKVDLLERIKADPGSEILISKVRERIYRLLERGFNIKKVTMDGWQSLESLQELRKKGIDSELLSVDRTMGPHESLKELIYLNLLQCYNYDILKNELKHLIVVNGKKVDHPPDNSKDVADAVAGSVYSLLTDESYINLPPSKLEYQISGKRKTAQVQMGK